MIFAELRTITWMKKDLDFEAHFLHKGDSKLVASLGEAVVKTDGILQRKWSMRLTKFPLPEEISCLYKWAKEKLKK